MLKFLSLVLVLAVAACTKPAEEAPVAPAATVDAGEPTISAAPGGEGEGEGEGEAAPAAAPVK